MFQEKVQKFIARFQSPKSLTKEEEELKAKSNFLNPLVEPLIHSRLSQGDSYGYEIAQSVKKGSGGRFRLPEGTMYPTLCRLMDQGYITDYESEEEGRRLRLYYQITPEGRERLQFRWTPMQRPAKAVKPALPRWATACSKVDRD